MTITDPDQVPATPVYTITVSSTGAAAVDGEEVTAPGLAPNAARVAALAEVRIKAAFHGRPVRVIAKESDGAAWPLIVAVDGTVTTLDHPHPTPARPPAPAPVQAPPAPPSTPPAGEFTVAIPREEAPAWMVAGTQAAAGQQYAAPVPAAADPHTPASPWTAPLPPEYGPLLAELVANEKAGRLAEATVAAVKLEAALTGTYGPLAPPTVNVMTTRAWLTLRQVEESEEWAETTELLFQTAQHRREAQAPEEDTGQLIRNAHAVWIRLALDDPEYARETAEPVLALLGDHPDNARRVSAMFSLLGGAAA
ncbi:hypothetical protein [Streptomyces marianii]|uniref:Uncharacterized protein n=1 Tax=Streptomyces marianii TaxID=1817406 RepID=A0A5R9DV33_9ACTN|nr:hypothetical protein [Streptomyces marianii]TLQ38874.1 hypothetical protein FEF34_40410 [Streptomyces marianii]